MKKRIAFSVLMALGMSLFMDLAMVLIKVGVTPDFLKIVLSEWMLGFAISIVPSFFLPPVIEKVLGN